MERQIERKRTNQNRAGWHLFVLLFLTVLVAGCSSRNMSFDLLQTSQGFQQSSAQINNKIDMLWVVDNSGSMDPLQQNLVSNFNQFIVNFQAKGFDYKMAVTTTDAYLAAVNYQNNIALAKVRDGAGMTHSGYFYITSLIPDIVKNFVLNATQGSQGSGDERAFQSLFETLNSSLNGDFLRPGAFKAIVILSDEDDFTDAMRPEYSWNKGGIVDHDYQNPNLISVDQVIVNLDRLTGSTATQKNYNVSTIAVLDDACQAQHVKQSSVSIIGKRYMELAQKTNGILGSICDASYASSLNFIQQRILELSTKFVLNRKPNVSSIHISVDRQSVLNDAANGWTFEASSNSIIFHGTAVPAASSQIDVSFLPAELF